VSQVALIEDDARRKEPDSSDERYTPTALYLRLTGGVCKLDLAATDESAKCRRFYSLSERGEDGLVLPWDDLWFNNPPWSLIEPWTERAQSLVRRRETPGGFQLLPAWTDRPWWHRWIEPVRDGRGVRNGVVCSTQFLRREKFGCPGDPEGLHAGDSANFWCVLVRWAPAP
jgi:hypothetical protein